MFLDVYLESNNGRKFLKSLEIKAENLENITFEIDSKLEGTAISAELTFLTGLFGRFDNRLEVGKATVWVQTQEEKEEWEIWLKKTISIRDQFEDFTKPKKQIRKVLPKL